MLFSVAIMILLYFVVIQTFFQGRKSMSSKAQPQGSLFGGNILDEVENQMFLNQFSEMYELEFEKKRKQMISEGDGDAFDANHNQAAIHQAAKKVIRDLVIKHQKQQEKQHGSGFSGSGEKLFIVVLLQNLKRMGEAALRWSFFTLNMFILTLTICQSPVFACSPGQLNCY